MGQGVAGVVVHYPLHVYRSAGVIILALDYFAYMVLWGDCQLSSGRCALAIDSFLSFVTGHVTFHLLSTTNLHRGQQTQA